MKSIEYDYLKNVDTGIFYVGKTYCETHRGDAVCMSINGKSRMQRRVGLASEKGA